MSVRPFEEIREDVRAASRIDDHTTVLALAAELDAVQTPKAEALAHRSRGWAMMLRGNYIAALEHGRAALALYEALADREGVAITLGDIGSALRRTGAYAEAMDHHQRARSIFEAMGDRLGEARAASNMAGTQMDCAAYDEAMTNYQRALEVFNEKKEHNAVARVNGQIGIIYYNLGDIRGALEYFERSMRLHDEQGDKGAVARSLGNIGNAYAALGDFPSALEHYRRSRSMHQELGEPTSTAMVMANIGVVYFESGDYPSALEYLQQALTMNEELDNRKGVAYVLDRIGQVHVRTGHADVALEHYLHAVKLYEELGERSRTARVSHGIGEVFEINGNLATAKEHYQQALSVFQEIGERRNVARATCALIGVILKMGNVDEARDLLLVFDTMLGNAPDLRVHRETFRAHLQELDGNMEEAHATLLHALRLANEIGLRPLIASMHERLRDLAFKRNDLVEYVEHNNEFTRITEEINGKDTATRLAMQVKQREIESRERDHQKHLAVLHSTLPKEVADRVARGEVVNDHFDNATVIFLDIVGFTEISSTMSSQDVIALLDDVFTQCDAICKEYNVTKIKTIGDSYMAVAIDNVVNAALCALEMSRINVSHEVSHSVSHKVSHKVLFRIGMHCGPVTAGVIGKERMQYDVWGDTVNVASRMESAGEPGKVHVSEAFASELKRNTESHAVSHEVSHCVSHTSVPQSELVTRHSSLVTTPRGSVDIKGKGPMNTYWLEVKE